nr:hypothetical protein HK105_004115 [Polyrhizophydium stewartii]
MQDYHVIMIMPIKPALKPAQAAPATAAAAAATAYVYDLDSVLPFPAAFGEYVARALRTDAAARLPAQYQRNFRVVPASLFLEHFASDRSHMLNKDGSWTAEPPIAPCIATEASTMNLSEYVSMETNLDSATFGKVYTEAEFVAKYAQPPAPAES